MLIIALLMLTWLGAGVVSVLILSFISVLFWKRKFKEEYRIGSTLVYYGPVLLIVGIISAIYLRLTE